jgi:hypothetical protein
MTIAALIAGTATAALLAFVTARCVADLLHTLLHTRSAHRDALIAQAAEAEHSADIAMWDDELSR